MFTACLQRLVVDHLPVVIALAVGVLFRPSVVHPVLRGLVALLGWFKIGVACVGKAARGAARATWSIYCLCACGVRRGFSCALLQWSAVHAWVWGKTVAGRQLRLQDKDSPSADNVLLPRGGLAYRSWAIVEEAAGLCRAQLGLERTSNPSDLATRTLVKRTVWGILTDKTQYADLRKADAVRLLPHAAEMALSPTSDEIESLRMASSAPFARNRALARGAWGTLPSTWFEWVLSCLGLYTGEVYLPPVCEPSF